MEIFPVWAFGTFVPFMHSTALHTASSLVSLLLLVYYKEGQAAFPRKQKKRRAWACGAGPPVPPPSTTGTVHRRGEQKDAFSSFEKHQSGLTNLLFLFTFFFSSFFTYFKQLPNAAIIFRSGGKLFELSRTQEGNLLHCLKFKKN